MVWSFLAIGALAKGGPARYCRAMFDVILSLVMLCALALLAGGTYLLVKGVRKQGVLMIVLALVMVANAAIWVIPDSEGGSPLEQAAAGAQSD